MKARIVGAGAHGRVVLDILRAQARHDAFAFVDDDPEMPGLIVNGVSVECGLEESLRDGEGIEMIIALGNPDLRHRVAGMIAAAGIPLLNAIHPSAVVAPSAVLAEGIVVGPTAVINSNANIAGHVVINTGAIVEHDCKVGAYSALGPGAQLGGRVTLGESAFISTGAIVLSRLTIGTRTVVAAGALVTHDLPDHVLAMGIPAKYDPLGGDFNWNRVL
jgi:UDP-perosamine 4-acetyltransferase